MNNPAPKTYSDVTSGDNKNIFVDPNLKTELDGDPVFKFLKNYWRPLAVAVVAVFAIWYSKNAYQDAVKKNAEEFSSTFSQLQSDYEELKSAQERVTTAKAQLTTLQKTEEIEKQKAKIVESEKNLEDVSKRITQELSALNNTSGVYKDLGNVYSGLIALDAGDIEKAKSLLNNKKWAEVKDPLASERVALESGYYALARHNLQTDSTFTEGKEMLQELADKGSVANVASAITLSRLAETDEDKANALASMQAIVQKDPIQSELLESEIQRLQ